MNECGEMSCGHINNSLCGLFSEDERCNAVTVLYIPTITRLSYGDFTAKDNLLRLKVIITLVMQC